MGPCQTQLFDQIGALSTNEKISAQFVSALIAKPAIPSVEAKVKPSITLDSIFPTQQEETKIQKARQILGEIVTEMTDEELESHITKFQYLMDCWLDDFEKKSFNGKTLDQLLREG